MLGLEHKNGNVKILVLVGVNDFIFIPFLSPGCHMCNQSGRTSPQVNKQKVHQFNQIAVQYISIMFLSQTL